MALVAGLQQALTDAQNAQKISKAKLLFPFGSTQATRRYECIVNALKEMDGAQIIKPKGSPHELVVLGDNLIYPFRYAKDGNVPIQRARVTEKKVSGLIAELFALYGPEPQPSLFDQSGDNPEAASEPARTTLTDQPRLVLLAYASNERTGVLNVWLGEGDLGPRGHVGWLPGRHQRLPLTWLGSDGDECHGLSGPVWPVPGPRPTGASASPEASPRFDDGVMPAVPLTARAPVERVTAISSRRPQSERHRSRGPMTWTGKQLSLLPGDADADPSDRAPTPGAVARAFDAARLTQARHLAGKTKEGRRGGRRSDCGRGRAIRVRRD